MLMVAVMTRAGAGLVQHPGSGTGHVLTTGHAARQPVTGTAKGTGTEKDKGRGTAERGSEKGRRKEKEKGKGRKKEGGTGKETATGTMTGALASLLCSLAGTERCRLVTLCPEQLGRTAFDFHPCIQSQILWLVG